MPRLFTGLEIPTDVAERLAGLRGKLTGARWVDPQNYHITLRFVGDVDERAAADFAAELDAINTDQFDVTLDGLGSFGGRKPRSVWAHVAAQTTLVSLQRAHERAARAVGFEAESRNFAPHVTLARLRRSNAATVAAYLERHGVLFNATVPVVRFVLFSSRASSGGGPYVVEESYRLIEG